MDITASHAHLREIFLEFLGHPLGQSGHEDSLVELLSFADLFEEIVDLVLDRTHFDRRVEQTCRTHNLLYHKTFRFFELIVGRRRADEHLLACNGLEFIEFQRSVVCCRREAEAVFDEHLLARMVAAVHGPDLRDGHVALVDEGDEIIREIVDQTERAHALCTAVEISRIVLDARAVAHLLYELEIIFYPLLQTLGFEILSDFLEILALCHHVVLDLADRLDAALLRGHEVARRVYRDFIEFFEECAADRIDHRNCIDLLAEEFDADGIFAVADAYVYSVSADTECASLEIGFGP